MSTIRTPKVFDALMVFSGVKYDKVLQLVVHVRVEARNLRSNKHATQERDKQNRLHPRHESNDSHLHSLQSLGL